MVRGALTDQHGGMTQQQAPVPPAGGTAEDDFDARRIKDAPLRMRRSLRDRKIAGVCGGFAQYARIDPVVVRVVVAALTVVGGVGVVLYAAGWLLVPEEGSERAVVDGHHGRNHGEMRRVGWVIAAVLACAAVLSSGPWFGPGVWWIGWPLWPLLAVVGVAWFLLARADRPRAQPVAEAAGSGSHDTGRVPPQGPASSDVPPPPTAGRSRGDGVLAAVTTALAVIAVGVLWLIERTGTGLEPTAYVAAVVAVIGLGTLIGTRFGNGRWLVPLGVLAVLVLAGSTQVPVWSAGEYDLAPTRAADVPPGYEVGAGQIQLDLTWIEDIDQLDGRTLHLDIGAGRIRVVLPEDLGVDCDASLLLGELKILERESAGFDNDLLVSDSDDGGPVLRLELAGSTGQIEVSRS
ncbi:PspC domain-containing protein [soil metagenome]